MKDNDNSFGDFLKKRRRQKKLTLKSLAELADISPSYLSRIERGERNIPHANILKRLAPHLGFNSREILVYAGYLNEKENGDTSIADEEKSSQSWQEIIRDPSLESALQEIGSLTREEKEGLLLYLQAIKLRRNKQRE